MKPSLSIVIAVYNGAHFLKKCLPAIAAAADAETEIVLADDGSTDDSAALGKQFGARILTLEQRTGAANARNIGVQAALGEIILFVDADVVVQTDTIRHLRRIFAEKPEFSAVFGSYDDAPGEPDFFSQYRNLMHHFFHQTGSREAETFWSGFGAIKRQAFLEVGGFDGEKFEIPSVEDIELGYRLREKGHRILLVPELQAKHLKKWTFYSILRTDFWQRAVPWVEMLLLNPQVKHDLNAQTSQKISALLAGVFLLSLAAVFWQWWFFFVALGSLLGLIAINKDFYTFFWRRKGFWFTLLVFPMHLLYFFYSSAAFAYSWLNVKILGRTVIVR
ncbi:MAG: glycosyltransferase family 2 protein [Acidobacteria bacterium]|nr:glycosyltransferase family 2 protein [Acidobacteriota bacterium]